MTSIQHTFPDPAPRRDTARFAYAPPANHWLRMIYAALLKIRCLLACLDEPEVNAADIAAQERYFETVLVNEPAEITFENPSVTGANESAVLYARLTKNTVTRNFRIFTDATKTTTLHLVSNSSGSNTLTVNFNAVLGDEWGGVTHIGGVVTGISDLVNGTYDFEFTFNYVEGAPVSDTELLPANHRAKAVTVSNTGELALAVKEGGAIVAIVQPGVSTDLPMPGLLAVSAGVWAGEETTLGKTASATAVRHVRCACGDVVVTYTVDPVGAFLL